MQHNQHFRGSALAKRVTQTLQLSFANPDEILKSVLGAFTLRDEDVELDVIEDDGAMYCLTLRRGPEGLSNILFNVMETTVSFEIEPIGNQAGLFYAETRCLDLI